jgi:hypothetical protein
MVNILANLSFSHVVQGIIAGGALTYLTAKE